MSDKFPYVGLTYMYDSDTNITTVVFKIDGAVPEDLRTIMRTVGREIQDRSLIELIVSHGNKTDDVDAGLSDKAKQFINEELFDDQD